MKMPDTKLEELIELIESNTLGFYEQSILDRLLKMRLALLAAEAHQEH